MSIYRPASYCKYRARTAKNRAAILLLAGISDGKYQHTLSSGRLTLQRGTVLGFYHFCWGAMLLSGFLYEPDSKAPIRPIAACQPAARGVGSDMRKKRSKKSASKSA
jgi:hypothetical protein